MNGNDEVLMASPGRESGAPPSPAPADGAGGRPAWLPALAFALVAGAASWAVGEKTYDHFKPSEAAARQQYAFKALNAEIARANARNGAVAFGALGGLLGLGLGLAGGLARRSARGAVAGGIVGLVAGGLAGAAPSFVVMPWQWENRHEDPGTLELLTPLLVHAGLWCGLGFAAGLAYGLGRGGPRPVPMLVAALGGLIGAAVGAAAYEVIGAVAFPLARTSNPISESPATRLLAQLCVAGFAALGAASSLRPSRPRPVGPGPAASG